jgi:nitroreductase
MTQQTPIDFRDFYKRHSCRKFLPKPVSNDILLSLISAGRYAPSALNNQPWFFHVVTNPSINSDIGAKIHERLKDALPQKYATAAENGTHDAVSTLIYSVIY